jgi:hypothetical protein
MVRVSILPLRKNETFSEMSTKNPGTFGGGDILKIRSTTDELTLISTQVLKI